MYSDVVMGVDHGLFEDALEDMKIQRGVHEDTELTGDDLKALVASYKDIVQDEAGKAFRKILGTTLGCDWSGVCQLDEYPRHHLPAVE